MIPLHRRGIICYWGNSACGGTVLANAPILCYNKYEFPTKGALAVEKGSAYETILPCIRMTACCPENAMRTLDKAMFDTIPGCITPRFSWWNAEKFLLYGNAGGMGCQ